MNLTLDPTTEKRIQKEIDLGHYADPGEVIAHAVALLVGEAELAKSEDQEPSANADTRIMSWKGVDGLEYQRRIRAEWPD